MISILAESWVYYYVYEASPVSLFCKHSSPSSGIETDKFIKETLNKNKTKIKEAQLKLNVNLI